MNNKLVAIFTLFLSFFLQINTFANPADEIIGTYWGPEKDGKIEIYKIGKKYFGKISWGKEPRKDTENPDPALRNRDVIGLTFLHDFVYDGNGTWEEGTIYDPKSGKTYDSKITIDSDGNLKLRGYVGISLFGRTEIFTRIKE